MGSVESPELSTALTTFVTERLDGLLGRYLPDGRMPTVFAGMRNDPGSLADLISVVSMLPELNVFQIGGREIEDFLIQLLRQVDPERCRFFASYRIAEALARFGPWQSNQLVAELTQAEGSAILQAIDSSALLPEIGSMARNYWAVLARCEHARDMLGVLEDREVFERCLEECQTMLAESPHGFLDDSQDFAGRYDIYSAEMLVFLEPLYDRFDRRDLDRCFAAHRQQLELCADDTTGSYLSWGRSTGLIGVAMTIELAALLLATERADDPGRVAGLLACAFEAQRDWWHEDLVSAHRFRHPYGYRGEHRLIQFSCDLLGKLAIAAGQLRGLDEQPAPVDPASWRDETVDRLLLFNDAHCAAWIYRHGELGFQLPLVAGHRSDYLPWPQQPGLLEVPSDSAIVCGLPVVLVDGRTWSVAGPPDDIVKTPGILSLRYDALRCLEDGETRPASARIVYRANSSAVEARFDWQVAGLQGASICVPEAARPLQVSVDGRRLTTFDCDGLANWRSFWRQLKRLYQTEVATRGDELKTTLRVALAD